MEFRKKYTISAQYLQNYACYPKSIGTWCMNTTIVKSSSDHWIIVYDKGSGSGRFAMWLLCSHDFAGQLR